MAELKMDNNDGNTVRPGPLYFFLEPHADGVLRRLNVLAFQFWIVWIKSLPENI
jgi:hypothetical protein